MAITLSALYQQLDYLDEQNDEKDFKISQFESELLTLKQQLEELNKIKEISENI